MVLRKLFLIVNFCFLVKWYSFCYWICGSLVDSLVDYYIEGSMLGVGSFKICDYLYSLDYGVVVIIIGFCRMCLVLCGFLVNFDEGRGGRLEFCFILGLKFFDIILEVVLKRDFILFFE